MRLYLFPPSARALGVVALKNHLALDCELCPIDLGRGDQRVAEYGARGPRFRIRQPAGLLGLVSPPVWSTP